MVPEREPVSSAMYTAQPDFIGIVESDRLAAERHIITRWLQEPVSASEMFISLFLSNALFFVAATTLNGGN